MGGALVVVRLSMLRECSRAGGRSRAGSGEPWPGDGRRCCGVLSASKNRAGDWRFSGCDRRIDAPWKNRLGRCGFFDPDRSAVAAGGTTGQPSHGEHVSERPFCEQGSPDQKGVLLRERARVAGLGSSSARCGRRGAGGGVRAGCGIRVAQ